MGAADESGAYALAPLALLVAARKHYNKGIEQVQLTVSQPELDVALRAVSRAASPRRTLPVLGGICLEADQRTLRLRATDLEISVQLAIPVEVTQPGAIVLPGRYLADLVHRLPPGPLQLTVQPANQVVHIRWDGADCTLHGLPADQFPVEPDASGPAVRLDSEALRRLLTETGFATGHDETRPWMTGICLTIAGPWLTAMATNAAVIAWSQAPIENSGDATRTTIVPGRCMAELRRQLDQSSPDTCTIRPAATQLVFELGPLTVSTRLLDGTFPDPGQVLPADYPTSVRLDRTRLLALCQRAALVAEEGAIRLEGDALGLTMSARSAEVGQVTERMPGEGSGAPFGVAVNVRYVLEGLQSMAGDQVLLEYNARGVRFRTGEAATAYFVVGRLGRF